ncbi:MAG: iron ABC transporter ATP-binding protein [Nitrospira sp. SG-bin1]|nr:MAG: iron ABC transporter ATP-binding protein [Nitrospira sp. SG-bin1]
MSRRHAYDLQAVRFHYQSNDSDAVQWTLEDLSFPVRYGEVLGVVGPNGSGKTSLLKVLARLLNPVEGRIDLFGRDLVSMPQREVACLVGVVPQDTQQLFPFTVAETVLMGRFPHQPRGRWAGGLGWESREDVAIAEQAMMTMDVVHLARRAITDLSGGERQRTVIARALAQTPKVLLLDEPTAFLDLHHQIEICSVLRRLRDERGLTVVFVSHDLNLVSQYCDRILLLDRGQILRLGSPHEVIEPDVLESVYRCRVLVDRHPSSGLPRVTLPGRHMSGGD